MSVTDRLKAILKDSSFISKIPFDHWKARLNLPFVSFSVFTAEVGRETLSQLQLFLSFLLILLLERLLCSASSCWSGESYKRSREREKAGYFCALGLAGCGYTGVQFRDW